MGLSIMLMLSGSPDKKSVEGICKGVLDRITILVRLELIFYKSDKVLLLGISSKAIHLHHKLPS